MGYVLIFNNETFENPNSNRNGSLRDLINLKKVFYTFNFRMKIVRNPTKLDIGNSMKLLLTEEQLGNALCLVVVVMSHGNRNDYAMTKDGRYSIEKEILHSEVFKKFKDLPKILITQACNVGSVKSYNSQMSNVLRIDSTFQECASHRFRDGSPFIQLFCKQLIKFGFELDIESIVDKVLNDFQKEYQHLTGIQNPTKKDIGFRGKVCFDKRVRETFKNNTAVEKEFLCWK